MIDVRVSDLIEAFLATQTDRPWAWGTGVDCCLTLADWSIARGTTDPAYDLRGMYHDETGARRIVAEHGGLIPIFAEMLPRVGWVEAEAPNEGDIAVIGSPFSIERQWGAIRHDGKWKVRMDVGFVPFIARPLAIWNL